MNQTKKIIIIGGGFAGISCAKQLKNTDCEITLLDQKNHHLFQPLLYQVATAALSPADIATPLREVFTTQSNVKVLMHKVDKIDQEEKTVILSNSLHLQYDYLVVATGSRHHYFQHLDWEAIAPGLKTIEDGLKIREKLLLSFEKAETTTSQKKRNELLTFVIIGGGPTGVEMAGAIAEIAFKTLKRNFHYINPDNSLIYLVESSERLLPNFPANLSKKVKTYLEKMGVKVILGKRASQVMKNGVQIDKEFIATQNIIWAAGNIASPLIRTLTSNLDPQGRAIVNQDLSIPHEPNIFVIGDAASVKDRGGNPIPAVAPAAIQEGRFVGKTIARDLKNKARKTFVYFDKGGVATVGKNKAVGYFRKVCFYGFFAWIIWAFIHIFYLINYRNRLGVMLAWFFHYLHGTRGARVIHKDLEK